MTALEQRICPLWVDFSPTRTDRWRLTPPVQRRTRFGQSRPLDILPQIADNSIQHDALRTITVVASKLQNLVTNGLRPMNERYSAETLKRTVALIQERFHTSITHSERLAAAALNGIDARGLDPDDWATVVATVDVVVRSWISGNGTNPVGTGDK